MIKTITYPHVDEWAKLQQRPAADQTSLFEIVKNIFNQIQNEGDKAVSALSKQFDGVSYSSSPLAINSIKDAERKIPASLKESIYKAYQNIYTFHASQSEPTKKIEATQGVTCWRDSSPFD